MTLRQLQVFLAIAREKSFSRAAKSIHSSQPTMSEHVAELELELGKKVFFRRGREVTLTEAGRVLERYAASAILAVEGARQAVDDLDGLGHGSLMIGASTTPGIYVMPGIIANFRGRYPGVELRLQIANSQVAIRQFCCCTSTGSAAYCWNDQTKAQALLRQRADSSRSST